MLLASEAKPISQPLVFELTRVSSEYTPQDRSNYHYGHEHKSRISNLRPFMIFEAPSGQDPVDSTRRRSLASSFGCIEAALIV